MTNFERLTQDIDLVEIYKSMWLADSTFVCDECPARNDECEKYSMKDCEDRLNEWLDEEVSDEES